MNPFEVKEWTLSVNLTGAAGKTTKLTTPLFAYKEPRPLPIVAAELHKACADLVHEMLLSPQALRYEADMQPALHWGRPELENTISVAADVLHCDRPRFAMLNNATVKAFCKFARDEDGAVDFPQSVKMLPVSFWSFMFLGIEWFVTADAAAIPIDRIVFFP